MSVSTVRQTYMQSLSKIYDFRRENEVKSFLDNNSYLHSLLVDAHEAIQNHFGLNAHVALEVFHDPEADDESELFVLIQTKLPVDEARRRRAQFDEEWWLGKSSQARCRLNIDLEYA